MRSLLALTSGLILLLLALHAPADGSPPPGSGCNEIFHSEPVIVFHLSGGTLASQIEESLLVFNNGSVLHARSETFPAQMVVEAAFVSQGAVRSLFQDLVGLGASGLCDQNLVVSETPLRTLTLMRGTPNSLSHTFSYYGFDIPYQPIDDRIRNFIAVTFP